ncbi:TetR family transcriptional regulator [Marinithermofilum abyssi]|uniref:TetR family transcriptional regulator n=1 Tax=Marinithermofilum abyssi TaxID=1571185 RepID=A0A8J2YAE6_9BACL|nr:TetR/AcrR family transcriptional regulator [Marinithermofilum abyssi]GGE12114.1 TetR family transcriptional regulator [Marinithermofilum abyssi]
MSNKRKKLDPRVVRTRQMLRNALIELIGEKGYDSISVQDITQRATLNRATFYLHYRDKEDLLNQSIKDILTELVKGMKKSRLIDENITDSNGNVIRPLSDLVYVFEHVAQHEQFYKVMLGNKGQQRFLFRLLDVFVDVLNERLTHSMSNDIRPAIPKEILIQYAASAYLGVIAWWLRNDLPYTPEYMATQLTRLRVQHIQT